MDRRKFLKSSAACAAAIATAGSVPAEAGSSRKAEKVETRLDVKDRIVEPSRSIPVVDGADVVVVGGGPAGFAASIAAAREGCDVLLLERGYFLGGLFTGCDVTILNDMYTPTPEGRVQAVYGICDELCRRLDAHGMLAWLRTPPNVDTEATKYFMERMCVEAGVRILYGVQAAQVSKSGDRIDAVIIETKSGRVAVKSKFVVDCTGDGDILEWTGEDFNEYRYDISSMWRAGNLGDSGYGSVTPNAGVRTGHLGAGIQDVDGLDMYVLSDAQIELRQRIWDEIQKLRVQQGSEGAYIVSSPSVVGVRITRVLNSVFNVTLEGAVKGESYEDVIGFTGSDSSVEWNGVRIPGEKRRMWQIPYRSLVPKTMGNLLVAGRCFGFEQGLRYDAREVGTCIMTGEAAGAAAAQAVAGRCSCRDVDVPRLQKTLRAAGAKLDW